MYLGEALRKYDKVRLPHWGSGSYVYLSEYVARLNKTYDVAKNILSSLQLISDQWEEYSEQCTLVEAIRKGWRKMRRRAWKYGEIEINDLGTIYFCLCGYKEDAGLMTEDVLANDWEEVK